MAKPITARIDLSKIAKEHIFHGKNGAKYLNVAVFPNKDGTDQYGFSHYIVQDIPKEARDAGERGAILGNLKMPDDAPREQQRPQHSGREAYDRDYSPSGSRAQREKKYQDEDDITF